MTQKAYIQSFLAILLPFFGVLLLFAPIVGHLVVLSVIWTFFLPKFSLSQMRVCVE